MPRRHPWQRYLTEFIGTFAIVFAACGAVIADVASNGKVSLLGIAFAPGLMVMAMIYTLGPISAAHFNPAVTIAFAVTRHFAWRHVPAYVLAQLAGALLAVGMLTLIYGADIAQKANFAAHLPNTTLLAAVGIEIVLTFFLMLVIMAVATDRRTPVAAAGLAIGMMVAVCILLGAGVSGASMNPVRSLAPALFAGGAALLFAPVYIFAPMVGAILAALCYEQLRDGDAYAVATEFF